MPLPPGSRSLSKDYKCPASFAFPQPLQSPPRVTEAHRTAQPDFFFFFNAVVVAPSPNSNIQDVVTCHLKLVKSATGLILEGLSCLWFTKLSLLLWLSPFSQMFAGCLPSHSLRSAVIQDVWVAGQWMTSSRSPPGLTAWVMLLSPPDHTIKLHSSPAQGLFVLVQKRLGTNSHWLISA